MDAMKESNRKKFSTHSNSRNGSMGYVCMQICRFGYVRFESVLVKVMAKFGAKGGVFGRLVVLIRWIDI